MDIALDNFEWTQVDGDVNPGAHGGTIARSDGDSIELRKIMPTREYVGDGEAAELGFPFWSKDGYFDRSDLQLDAQDVQRALQTVGLRTEDLEAMKPQERGVAIAIALLDYGHGDEGPAGWAKDIIPGPVKWWQSKGRQGWRFLAYEDRDFRQLLRERDR